MIHTRIHALFVAAVFFIALFAVSSLSVNPVRAATGSMYFAPANVTLAQGSLLNVAIRGNAPEYSAAQINLLYDPSSLEYVSYSLSGGVFDSEVGYSSSPGLVKITLYTIPGPSGPITGDQLLATFQFRALKGSGSTEINFQRPQSALVIAGQNAGSILDSAKLVATFSSSSTPPPTLAPAPAPPTSSTPSSTLTTQQPKPTQPNSPTVKATPAPAVVAPTGDSTKPKLRSVQLAGFVGQPLSVRIDASEPSSATVRFGNNSDRLTQSATVQSSSASFYVPLGAFSAAFVKDSSYFFAIELTDPAGNKTVSDVYELPIEAVTVEIAVKDESGQPLANTAVIINGKQLTTDERGVVLVSNAIPGSLVVSVMKDGAEKYIGESTIVAGVSKQSFAMSPEGLMKIDEKSRSILNVSYIVPTLVALLLLVGFVLYVSRRNQFNSAYRFAHSGKSSPLIYHEPQHPVQAPAPSTVEPIQAPQQPVATTTATPTSQEPWQPTVYKPTPLPNQTQPTAILTPQPRVTPNPEQPESAQPDQQDTNENR